MFLIFQYFLFQMTDQDDKTHTNAALKLLDALATVCIQPFKKKTFQTAKLQTQIKSQVHMVEKKQIHNNKKILKPMIVCQHSSCKPHSLLFPSIEDWKTHIQCIHAETVLPTICETLALEETPEQLPCSQMSDDHPKRQSSDEQPKRQSSDEQPEKQSSDEQPKRQSSDEQPEKQSSDEQPEKQSSDEQPEKQSSDEQPKRQSFDEQPEKQSSDEQPEKQSSDEQPKRQSFDEQPERQSSDEQPEKQSSDKQPKRQSSDEQPKSQTTDGLFNIQCQHHMCKTNLKWFPTAKALMLHVQRIHKYPEVFLCNAPGCGFIHLLENSHEDLVQIMVRHADCHLDLFSADDVQNIKKQFCEDTFKMKENVNESAIPKCPEEKMVSLNNQSVTENLLNKNTKIIEKNDKLGFNFHICLVCKKSICKSKNIYTHSQTCSENYAELRNMPPCKVVIEKLPDKRVQLLQTGNIQDSTLPSFKVEDGKDDKEQLLSGKDEDKKLPTKQCKLQCVLCEDELGPDLIYKDHFLKSHTVFSLYEYCRVIRAGAQVLSLDVLTDDVDLNDETAEKMVQSSRQQKLEQSFAQNPGVFMCHVCQRQFQAPSKLQQHYHTHLSMNTDLLPYKCRGDGCLERFLLYALRSKHEKTCDIYLTDSDKCFLAKRQKKNKSQDNDKVSNNKKEGQNEQELRPKRKCREKIKSYDHPDTSVDKTVTKTRKRQHSYRGHAENKRAKHCASDSNVNGIDADGLTSNDIKADELSLMDTSIKVEVDYDYEYEDTYDIQKRVIESEAGVQSGGSFEDWNKKSFLDKEIKQEPQSPVKQSEYDFVHPPNVNSKFVDNTHCGTGEAFLEPVMYIKPDLITVIKQEPTDPNYDEAENADMDHSVSDGPNFDSNIHCQLENDVNEDMALKVNSAVSIKTETFSDTEDENCLRNTKSFTSQEMSKVTFDGSDVNCYGAVKPSTSQEMGTLNTSTETGVSRHNGGSDVGVKVKYLQPDMCSSAAQNKSVYPVGLFKSGKLRLLLKDT